MTDLTTSARELRPADVLRRCRLQMVPVNVAVGVAIEAHQHAMRQEPAAQVSHFALRAVLLARTPDLSDHRTKLDYLTSLPESASPGHREEKLACVSRAALGDAGLTKKARLRLGVVGHTKIDAWRAFLFG